MAKKLRMKQNEMFVT